MFKKADAVFIGKVALGAAIGVMFLVPFAGKYLSKVKL